MVKKHWSYEGEDGPEHWDPLISHSAACSAGQEQSPTDIPLSAPVHAAEIAFNYQPTDLDIVNSEHSVKVNYDQDSSITVAVQRPALVLHVDLVHRHHHVDTLRLGVCIPSADLSQPPLTLDCPRLDSMLS